MHSHSESEAYKRTKNLEQIEGKVDEVIEKHCACLIRVIDEGEIVTPEEIEALASLITARVKI